MRKYYEANPNAIKNKHLLALHEALHAAVCEALGDTWEKLVLRKATGFVEESGQLEVGVYELVEVRRFKLKEE